MAGSGRVATGVLVVVVVVGSAGPALAQTWNVDSSGTWGTASNWSPATVPDAIGAAVTLGSAITAPRTITLAAPATVGSLEITSGSSYTVASSGPANTLTFDTSTGGPTLVANSPATQIISAPVVLNDPLAVQLAGTTAMLMSGTISGSGGLTKTGTGTLSLTGTNTYAGNTAVSAGTLLVGDGGTTGSITGPASVASGATFGFNRSTSYSYGGAIDNAGTVSSVGSGLLILNGVISGTGDFTKSGTGQTILTANSTWSGGTTVSAGTLLVGNNTTTGSITGTVTNNATFGFALLGTKTIDATIVNTGTVRNIGTGTVTLSGVLSGTGSVVNAGTGTLVFTAANTYTGGTTSNNGTLRIGDGGTTGSIVGNVTLGAAGTLQLQRSDTFVVDALVQGSGSLKQLGSGTAILAQDNTYTGLTDVQGPLQVGNGGTSGAIAGNASVVSGATLSFNRSDTTSHGGAIANSGTVGNIGTGTLTFGGIVSGTGAFTQGGTGTTVLAAANTWSGGTTISAGTLQIGSGGTTGSIAGNVTNNGTLAINRSDDLGLATVVSGTGGLTKLNTNILTLTGANTYGGATSVSSGTLKAGAVNTFGTNSAVTVASGATLDLANLNQAVGSLAGAGSVTLGSATLDTGGANTSTAFSGGISGSGALLKTGSGSLTLSGSNSYGGGTTVSGGRLVGTTGSLQGAIVNNAAVTFDQATDGTYAGILSGSGSLTKSGSGALTLSGSNSYGGGTTVSGGTLIGTTSSLQGAIVNNAAVTFDQATGGTYAGTLSGSGSLTKSGSGTLTLSGSNSYGGSTTVSAGTLKAGAVNTFAGSSATTIATGATLDLANLDQVVGSLAGAGGVALGSATLTAGGNDAGTTFSGVLSGTGGLAKTGSGTLVLSGNNSYGGLTTVSGGTLQVGNGGAAGSIAGAVVNAGTLAFDRSDTLGFAGAVSGSGALRQAGTGTTVLTGTSTYTGGTTIAAGTLQLGNGATAGSIAGAVVNNGTLAVNRSDSVTMAGAISGSGALIQAGSGTTILTAANSYGGTTTISAGTLQLSAAGSLGAGAVVNNALLSVNRADSITIANPISGTGRLVQEGSGTTILTAANTFSGGTTVSSGMLVLNGSLASSTTIAAAGALGGNGTIAGTLTVNGIIAPGNSIGTMTVNGTYVQNAGSTYRVEINPAGQSDRIVVNGTATLNGGTVQVVTAPGTYGQTTYTILTATGGVTGQFAGLSTDYAFRITSLAYDANAVYLVLGMTVTPFTDGARTPNQRAVGQALDAVRNGATGDFYTVLAALSELSTAQGPAALDAISGQPWADLGTTALATVQGFMATVGRQVALARGVARTAERKSDRVALADACGSGCGGLAVEPAWNAWGSALGSTGNVAGDGNAAGLTYTLGGFAAGIDRVFGPGLLGGIAVGSTAAGQAVDGFASTASSTGLQASLYASLSAGGFYADVLAGYGTSDTQLTRGIVVPGLQPRTARGRSGADQWFAQAETGYRVALDQAATTGLAPFLRLQAATARQYGFSEWGAASLDLAVSSQVTNSLRSLLGAQFDAALDIGAAAPLDVQVRVGWSHEYADTARPLTAAFAGAPGTPFTVYGAQPQRDAVGFGLALETKVADNAAAFLRYDGEVGSGFNHHSLNIGLHFRW